MSLDFLSRTIVRIQIKWLYLYYNLKAEMMRLRIKDNLHLIDGEIVSYSTVVGRVEKDCIKTLGRWSRTTTRHVYELADRLGLPIEHLSKEKIDFLWYAEGARVRMDDVLSPRTSALILAKASESKLGLTEAAILCLHKLKGKDLIKCRCQLLERGIDVQKIKDIALLNQLGII